MRHKPNPSEEEFFAKEDAERLHDLHENKKREMDRQEREKVKALHYMKCPKCGSDLKTITLQAVEIDTCDACGVIVLDKGELEKLQSRNQRFFSTLMDVFKEKG